MDKEKSIVVDIKRGRPLVQITSYVIFFLLGTMVGWVIDSGYRSLMDRRWTNAGYFIGPFCPIYGFGGMVLLLLVSFFNGYPLIVRCLLYFAAMTLVELVGGLFSTYVLKVRLWDYSDAPFNLFGQVDMLHSFYWLVLALVFEGLVWPVFSFINDIAILTRWVDLIVFFSFIIAFSFALLRRMVKERKRIQPFIREGTPEALWKHLEKVNDEYVQLMEKFDEDLLIPSEKRSREFLDRHEHVLEETYNRMVEIRKKIARIRGKIPTSRIEKEMDRFSLVLMERRKLFQKLRAIEDLDERSKKINRYFEKLGMSRPKLLDRMKRTSESISWRSYVKMRGRSFHPFAFLDRFPQWQAGWKRRKEDIFTLIRSDKR